MRLREPQTKSRKGNLKIHENPHRHLLSSAEVKEGKRCLKKELRKWEINSTIQMTTSQTVLRHRHSVYFWAALIVLSILTRSRLDKPEKRKTLQLFAVFSILFCVCALLFSVCHLQLAARAACPAAPFMCLHSCVPRVYLAKMFQCLCVSSIMQDNSACFCTAHSRKFPSGKI